jgi:hypothetical protein
VSAGRSWFDTLTTNGPFALSLSKGNGSSHFVRRSKRRNSLTRKAIMPKIQSVSICVARVALDKARPWTVVG